MKWKKVKPPPESQEPEPKDSYQLNVWHDFLPQSVKEKAKAMQRREKNRRNTKVKKTQREKRREVMAECGPRLVAPNEEEKEVQAAVAEVVEQPV